MRNSILAAILAVCVLTSSARAADSPERAAGWAGGFIGFGMGHYFANKEVWGPDARRWMWTDLGMIFVLAPIVLSAKFLDEDAWDRLTIFGVLFIGERVWEGIDASALARRTYGGGAPAPGRGKRSALDPPQFSLGVPIAQIRF